MAKQTYRRRQGLNGAKGVAVAIIDQSLVDYESGDLTEKADAEVFYAGPWYRKLTESLGLVADELLLPQEIDNESRERIMKLSDNGLTPPEAAETLNELIQHEADERGLSYVEAFNQLREEQPALFDTYMLGVRKELKPPTKQETQMKDIKLRILASEIQEWSARDNMTIEDVFQARPKLAERYQALMRSK